MEKKQLKTCIVLPAFNEESNIAAVLDKINAQAIDAVVIDDGSSDSTGDVAYRHGAFVITHKNRGGKGASLRDGFAYVAGKEYDFVIALDSDGQHDPNEIPLFLRQAQISNADIIVGNRLWRPTGMPIVRLFTNRFMSLVISALCGCWIPDSQCGFRLFRVKAISSIKIEGNKFEIDSEPLVKLARRGYAIESIPITSIYGKEKSQINPLVDTMRFFRFVIKAIFYQKGRNENVT